MRKVLFGILTSSFFLFGFIHHQQEPVITMRTSLGTIQIKLYNETPRHRDNFLNLARNHFYDSLLFHRVIKGFMIQGGDPTSRRAVKGQALGDGDVGYTVSAEFNENLFHKRGALAAARDNNPAKASSGCQFYIVQGHVFTETELSNLEKKLGIQIKHREVYTSIGGAPHLDMNYTVFGEVTQGMNVVDSIAAVKVGAGDRPLTDVRILEVKVGQQ